MVALCGDKDDTPISGNRFDAIEVGAVLARKYIVPYEWASTGLPDDAHKSMLKQIITSYLSIALQCYRRLISDQERPPNRG